MHREVTRLTSMCAQDVLFRTERQRNVKEGVSYPLRFQVSVLKDIAREHYPTEIKKR